MREGRCPNYKPRERSTRSYTTTYDLTEAALLDESPEPDFMLECDEALQAAIAASNRGDYEAAVVHCLRGFRARTRMALGED
jgi:hypothetical protein